VLEGVTIWEPNAALESVVVPSLKVTVVALAEVQSSS
jgi:hypothetical protein